MNKNTQKNRIHQDTCFLLYAAMVLLYSVFLLAAFATYGAFSWNLIQEQINEEQMNENGR